MPDSGNHVNCDEELEASTRHCRQNVYFSPDKLLTGSLVSDVILSEALFAERRTYVFPAPCTKY
jgi:hypothetical protein